MRAPGAGVPAVSLRAAARPADLRRPVPHPKPGAHSHTVAAEKPVARLTVQVHLKPAHGASGRVAFPGHARGVDTVHPTDSPVEGAVRSEPVSEGENSLLARKIQGNTSILAIHPPNSRRKQDVDQCLTVQIPYTMEQGINSAAAAN